MFRGVSALVRRHRRRRRRLRLKSLGQIIALQLFCFGMYLYVCPLDERCAVISADSLEQNMLRWSFNNSLDVINLP